MPITGTTEHIPTKHSLLLYCFCDSIPWEHSFFYPLFVCPPSLSNGVAWNICSFRQWKWLKYTKKPYNNAQLDVAFLNCKLLLLLWMEKYVVMGDESPSLSWDLFDTTIFLFFQASSRHRKVTQIEWQWQHMAPTSKSSVYLKNTVNTTYAQSNKINKAPN